MSHASAVEKCGGKKLLRWVGAGREGQNPKGFGGVEFDPFRLRSGQALSRRMRRMGHAAESVPIPSAAKAVSDFAPLTQR